MTIHKAVLAVEIIVLRELWKQAHTHSFCVTGTHAEANVLARHVQPVVILNTRHRGWDVSNSHRCESGVQRWG